MLVQSVSSFPYSYLESYGQMQLHYILFHFFSRGCEYLGDVIFIQLTIILMTS